MRFNPPLIKQINTWLSAHVSFLIPLKLLLNHRFFFKSQMLMMKIFKCSVFSIGMKIKYN